MWRTLAKWTIRVGLFGGIGTLVKRLVDDRIDSATNAAIDSTLGPIVSELLLTPHGVVFLVFLGLIAIGLLTLATPAIIDRFWDRPSGETNPPGTEKGETGIPRDDRTSIRPNPDQLILDAAHEQLENPIDTVILLGRYIKGINLDPKTKSPWIELAFQFRNTGFYSIVVGPVEGYVNHNTDRIIEPYETNGNSRYPPGHMAPIIVKQWLTREMAEEIYRELDTHKKIQTLGLSNLRMMVTSEGPGGKAVRMGFAGKDVFRFRD